MNTRNDIQNETDHQSAAEWFVALEAETVDRATNDAFIAWLNSAPENQAAYERCEAAAVMAEKLKNDPDLAWAFEESAQLAASGTPRLQLRSLKSWFTERKLEFGMAVLTIVGAAVVLVQYGGDEITEAPALSTGQMADTLAPEDAFVDPIVVLPGAVVVPSNSVAVLPFQNLGSDPASATTAGNLHAEILGQLVTMPSLYVPVQASVMPYADGGYSITDIASQLGVRGIVEGSVRQAGDRVRITVQLIDASTGEHLFAEAYDRLVTDLSDIHTDIVTNIAGALLRDLNVQTVVQGTVWRDAEGRMRIAVIDPVTGAPLWPSEPRTLVWVDRDGREEPIAVPQAPYTSLSLSPDGQRVAVSVARESNEDIWIYDLIRGTFSRLTFDPIDETAPVFSPDGEWVGYWDGNGQLRKIAASGGAPIGIADVEHSPNGMSWETDDTILFGQPEGIYRVSATGGVAELITVSEFDQGYARVSPDGRWLAYHSSETGRDEVYVRPFPNVGDGRWQVSVDGGREPLWSPGGQELFYRSSTGVIAVNVQLSPVFTAAPPQQLLSGNDVSSGYQTYDISPDGQRFIMMKSPSGSP